ncbi:MAG TPA: TonB family protein [Candidatus Kryptonia bacterium]|nr:TonB family protein [Candidatus Kryptonia bacterium]
MRSIRHFGAPFALSLALHTGVVLVLATISIRLAAPNAPPIVVTIREPSAPPPPLGKPAAAPGVAAPMPQSIPPPVVPKPRPKIARKPPPAAPPAAVSAPPPSAAGGGAAAGVPEGAIGGEAGGQVGGRVGEHGDRIWRSDEVAMQPEVISRQMPTYPPIARARGVEGLVVLEGIVDRDGRIEPDGLKVLHSIPLLDDAAIQAFRQWRFKPGYDQHGEPVRVILQIPFRFQLR